MMRMIPEHVLALLAGFLLDLILGDPEGWPHPVRLIGKLISGLEKLLYRETDSDAEKLRKGTVLTVLVPLITAEAAAFVLSLLFHFSHIAGLIAECIMCWQILSLKSLRDAAMKVYRALKSGDTEGARKAVSMIVGRDTEVLDADGITKAAVETVAENASDGVIAPMLFFALGGPVFAWIYKSINTMDSMIGYKNDRYLFFGRAAAKTDDVVNFVPSRFCAYMMIAAAFLLRMDAAGAARIHKRDCRKHASPNSAQTESACAGALDIRLAGDAQYFGRIVKKPFIGDPVRPVETEDIRRAGKLLYVTALLSLIPSLLLAAL